jgi:hypothetical protein
VAALAARREVRHFRRRHRRDWDDLGIRVIRMGCVYERLGLLAHRLDDAGRWRLRRIRRLAVSRRPTWHVRTTVDLGDQVGDRDSVGVVARRLVRFAFAGFRLGGTLPRRGA